MCVSRPSQSRNGNAGKTDVKRDGRYLRRRAPKSAPTRPLRPYSPTEGKHFTLAASSHIAVNQSLTSSARSTRRNHRESAKDRHRRTAFRTETPSRSGQRQSTLQLFLRRMRAIQQAPSLLARGRAVGGRRDAVQRLNATGIAAITRVETQLRKTIARSPTESLTGLRNRYYQHAGAAPRHRADRTTTNTTTALTILSTASSRPASLTSHQEVPLSVLPNRIHQRKRLTVLAVAVVANKAFIEAARPATAYQPF